MTRVQTSDAPGVRGLRLRDARPVLAPTDPLYALGRLRSRPVGAVFMVGARQAVAMDGLLSRVTRETNPGSAERIVLEFRDASCADVGSIGVPVNDVVSVRCDGDAVELDLGDGDCLILETTDGG